MSLFPHGVAANVRRESSFYRPIIRGERRKTYPVNPVDRKAVVQKRRRLYGHDLLPREFEEFFTFAQGAVLTVIALEFIATEGMPMREYLGNIAHRASVSIPTVAAALRTAEKHGMISIGGAGRARNGRSKALTIVATETWRDHIKAWAWKSIERSSVARSFARHRAIIRTGLDASTSHTGQSVKHKISVALQDQNIDSTLVSTSTLRAKEPEKPPCLPPLRPGFVRLVVRAGQLPAIATCLSLSVSSLVQGPGELFDEDGAFPPPQGRFGPRPGESPVPRRAFVGEASGT